MHTSQEKDNFESYLQGNFKKYFSNKLKLHYKKENDNFILQSKSYIYPNEVTF